MVDGSGFVFVTGGTGFIGRRVVARLVAGPWREVRALARSEASAAAIRAAGARPVAGSLLDRSGAWREAAAEAAWVVHCAQPNVLAGEEPLARPDLDANLLDALDERVVRRAVFVYGSSYYGAGAADESTSPRTPVGLGASFEPSVAALAERRRTGLDAVAALAAAVYGRGSWFLEWWLRSMARGEPVLVCHPAPRWSFIHVEDCARAIEFLLSADTERLEAAGREVILAGDPPTTLDRFLELLGAATGHEPILRRLDAAAIRAALPPLAASYLTADMPHSNARLRRLGFEPRYPTIEAGLAALERGRS